MNVGTENNRSDLTVLLSHLKIERRRRKNAQFYFFTVTEKADGTLTWFKYCGTDFQQIRVL